MICPSCHTQNRDNAKFCKVCGYSFVNVPSTSAGTDVTNTANTANANSVATPVSVVTPPDPTNTALPPQAQSTLQPNNVTAETTQTMSENHSPAQPVQSVQTPVTTSGEPQGMQDGQVQQGQQSQAVQSEPVQANAQPVEVVVQDAAPAQDIQQSDTIPTNTNTDNDATQVLSHEEMQAIQARRLQQLAQDDAVQPALSQSPQGDVVAGEPAAAQEHNATEVSANADTGPGQTGNATTLESTDDTPVPPPPPVESLHPDAGIPHASPYEQEATTPPASVTPPSSATDDASSDATPQQETTGQPAQSVGTAEPTPGSDAAPGVQPSSTDSSALQVGAVLAGRYEVTDVIDMSGEEAHSAQPVGRIYHVIDHQGYQRCWNCGSTQNAEGDEFCIDCGAELLNAPYIMHEYPTNGATNDTGEAHVLDGTIVNTFVENGRTYVIEQPQEAQIAFPNGVHLLVAGDSDAGNIRRADPNEDSILVLQLQRVHESYSAPQGVFIIADGMGGHANGQGASRLIVNGIAQKMLNTLFLPPLNAEQAAQEVKPVDEATLISTFKDAVQEANSQLVQQNQRDKSDAGSTLTGFMIVDDHAYIINVGDSRTYMLREGTLYQLTTDHSLVGQLVASGLIEPDDVYTHPQRSQIFRSLGDKTNVQIDDFKQQLLPGDILLSCSDGLWEMVRNPQITDILMNAHDPQTACTQLIEAANANGGEDNVSAIVVFVR